MGIRSQLRAVMFAVLIVVVAGVGAAGAAKKTPPGNPPGNNGTIKVASDDQAEPNNEPHIDGCLLWVEFYNFDQDEQVHVTFEAHSPTTPPEGKTALLLEDTRTISKDPEGGEHDEDDVVSYSLSEELLGFEPHHEQGYHIKLSIDSLNAPGGAKHKVFWLNCSPSQPGTFRVIKNTEGDVPPGVGPFNLPVDCSHAPANTTLTLNPGDPAGSISVPIGTTCVVTEPNSQGATVQFSESGNDDGNLTDGQATVTSTEPVTVTVTNVFEAGSRDQSGTTEDSPPGAATPNPAPPNPATPNPGVEPAGTAVEGISLTAQAAPVAADTLPRTGGGLGLMVDLGAWTLTLGALASLAGRRR